MMILKSKKCNLDWQLKVYGGHNIFWGNPHWNVKFFKQYIKTLFPVVYNHKKIKKTECLIHVHFTVHVTYPNPYSKVA